MTTTDHLKALGSADTKYDYEGAEKSLLEKFANPMSTKYAPKIKIVSPEFTSRRSTRTSSSF